MKWAGAASVAFVIVSTAGLAACAADGDRTKAGTSSPVSDHNDADVVFASQMILHHQQALQLSGIAGWQARNAAVKKFARGVRAVQAPEMQQLSAWLTEWGKPVPSPSHGGHDGEESIPGMVSEDEFGELGRAQGALFDRMWIQLMARHAKGAIAMAKTEQTAGTNPKSIALAKEIEADRTTEITAMKRLLAQLPSS